MKAEELIRYFKSLGLTVHTGTKARGHQGFFLNNRIDISKNISENRLIPTLLHEFAHYIHSKLEPNMNKTGGSLEILFKSDNPIYKEELIKVTNFVDNNSLCVRLYEHKDRVKQKIKEYEEIVKKYYPKFQRSKKFKEFDKYIKRSNAKYLLKYDRVKLVEGGFFKKTTKLFSIDNIEKDFVDMPPAFAAYIRLHSFQKKQSRISARINKYKKYYEKPCELFARLVEGIYLDREWVEAIAPNLIKQFYDLLKDGYYMELEVVLSTFLHKKLPLSAQSI
ncbi:hypothetical protein BHV42_07180 [Candidatus Melainabacteria bacterium MEL.A1]|nr:hypothetical protein BHV42_07180 [Candidatus Melainabacteria bacterium MEL.A1]